jgi:hypothetical protein
VRLAFKADAWRELDGAFSGFALSRAMDGKEFWARSKRSVASIKNEKQ